jgi:hypothetical protein
MLNLGRPLLDTDDFDDGLLDKKFGEAYAKAKETGFAKSSVVQTGYKDIEVSKPIAPSIDQIASVAVLLDADISDLKADAGSIGYGLQAIRDYRAEKAQVSEALDLAWIKFGYPMLELDEEIPKKELEFRRAVKSAMATTSGADELLSSNYGLTSFLKTETKLNEKTGKPRQVVVSPWAPAYLPAVGWEEAVRKSALVFVAVLRPTWPIDPDVKSLEEDIEELRERFNGTLETIAELKAAGELAKARENGEKVMAEIAEAKTREEANALLTIKAEIELHINNIRAELAEIRKLKNQLPAVDVEETDKLLFNLFDEHAAADLGESNDELI